MNRRRTSFGRKGAQARCGAAEAQSGAAEAQSGTAEARRGTRRVAASPARVLYCGGSIALDVLLRDVSDSGARIMAPGRLPQTDTFELVFGSDRRPCRVVWRRDRLLGVAFTD